ncbi:MAG: transporter substrate-binding domain-containing protein [Anaerolineae bacterium]|nr:transporter substrate-binding domain-containing protein [Anaerolineae bacterium]
MLRRSLLCLSLGFSVGLACFQTACSQTPQGSLTPTVVPTRSVTSMPVAHGNPDETPIPSPVTTSALGDIRQRGELRVGVLYNYRPFGFLTDNGQVQGYEVDLMRNIAEKWEVDVTFVQVTRQTRLPILYSGNIDVLAAAMPHRRDMEQFVEFSDTTFHSGYVVLVSADGGIDTIAGLGSGAVAAIGSEAQDLLAQYATQVGITPTIRVLSTVEDAVSVFKNAEVGAITGRREDVMLAASSLSNVKILDEFALSEPYAFAVRRGDTPLRDMLNLTLLEITREGKTGEIFSSNFYGYAADLFPVYPGDPAYTFQTFPTDLPDVESIVDRIKRGEPLRVAGLALDANPGRFDCQPIVDGYNRAIINEIARRWHVPVSELPQTVGQPGLDLLKGGQADLVVGIQPNLSLVGQVAFSPPYYQRGLRLIHMQSVTIGGIADLEAKESVAAEPVALSESLIKDNNDIPRVKQITSNEEAFQLLTAGSVYAVVGDEFGMMLMLQTDDRLAVIERRYRLTNYAIALPFYDTELQALMAFTLQDMKRDGTLDRLREQYFVPYMPDDDPLEPLEFEIWPGDGSYLGVGG